MVTPPGGWCSVLVALARGYTIIQGTLDQHGFELLGFLYMWIFFPINIVEIFFEICDNLKKLR